MEEVRRVLAAETRDDAKTVAALFRGATWPAVECRSCGRVEVQGNSLVVGVGGSRLLRCAIRCEVLSTFRLGLATGVLETLRAVAASSEGSGSSRLRSGGDDCCEDVLTVAETSASPAVALAALKCCGVLCGSGFAPAQARRLVRLVATRKPGSVEALRDACSRLAAIEAASTVYDGRSVPVPKRWLEIGRDKSVEMPLVSGDWPFVDDEAYASAWFRLECDSLPGASLCVVSTDKGGGLRIAIGPDRKISAFFDDINLDVEDCALPRKWTHVALRVRRIDENRVQHNGAVSRASWRRFFEDKQATQSIIERTKCLRMELFVDGVLRATADRNAEYDSADKRSVVAATIGVRMDAKIAGFVVLSRAPSLGTCHAIATRSVLVDAEAPSLTADARCARSSVDEWLLESAVVNKRQHRKHDDRYFFERVFEGSGSRDDPAVFVAAQDLQRVRACAASALRWKHTLGALVFESGGALRHKEWKAAGVDSALAAIGGSAALVPMFLVRESPASLGTRLELVSACCRASARLCIEFVAQGGVDMLRRAVAALEDLPRNDAVEIATILPDLLDAAPCRQTLHAWSNKFAFCPHLWRDETVVFDALAAWAAQEPAAFFAHVGLCAYLARLSYYLPPHDPRQQRRRRDVSPDTLPLVLPAEPRQPTRASRLCVARLSAMRDVVSRLCGDDTERGRSARLEVLSFATNWDDDIAVAQVLEVANIGDDMTSELPAVLRSRLAFRGSRSVATCVRLLKQHDNREVGLNFRNAILATTPPLSPRAYAAFLEVADVALAVETTAISFDRLSDVSRRTFYSLCVERQELSLSGSDYVDRAFAVILATASAEEAQANQQRVSVGKCYTSDSSDDNEGQLQPDEQLRFCALVALLKASMGKGCRSKALDLAIAHTDETGDGAMLCCVLDDLSNECRSALRHSLPALAAVATAPARSFRRDIEPATENACRESHTKTPSFGEEDEDDEEASSSADSFADHAMRVSGNFDADDDEDDAPLVVKVVKIVAPAPGHPKVNEPPTKLCESVARACDGLLAAGVFNHHDDDHREADDEAAALLIATHLVKRRPKLLKQDAARLKTLVKRCRAHKDSGEGTRAALLALDAAHSALRRCDKDDETAWRAAELLYAVCVEAASLLIAKPKAVLPKATIDALVAMIVDGARRSSGRRETEEDDSGLTYNPAMTSDQTFDHPGQHHSKRWLSSAKKKRESLTLVTKVAAAAQAGLRKSWLSSRWLADELAAALAAVDTRADSAAWLDAAAANDRAASAIRFAARNAARGMFDEYFAAPTTQPRHTQRQRLSSVLRQDEADDARADRAWRACAKLLRAEWSPWSIEDRCTPRRYRVADRLDRLGRRCLLERDFDPKDFSSCAYSSRHDSATKRRAKQRAAAAVAASSLPALRSASSGASVSLDYHRGSFVVVPPPDPSIEALDDALVVGRFENAILVKLTKQLEGTVVLTRTVLRFEAGKTKLTFRLVGIERISPRRYVLQRRAVELYRANGTSVLVALNTHLEARELWAKLARLSRYHNAMPLVNDAPVSFSGLYPTDDPRFGEHTQPLLLTPTQPVADGVIIGDSLPQKSPSTEGPATNNGLLASPHVEDVFARHAAKLTEAWRKRRISNFAYLSALNEMSGRTYCDVSQWPVFPWVLADFESHYIDVDDPQQIRNLSRPMGALGPNSRTEAFVDRYSSFEDPTGAVPAFMFGSHYSSAAVVLHFLVRVQPFAELAVDLQGKTFDVPDRLFHSLRESWISATESMCDVKELVPELFYMAEMLLNESELPLGSRQRPASRQQDTDDDDHDSDDDPALRVDDVTLPPWAHGDAHHFVRMHRNALEGEAVSASLHRWIDLIFGVDQRGPNAVRATNVFYHLTYEGSVDLDDISDPEAKAACVEQIKHFGQTPPQLWTSSRHPPRLPASACPRSLFSNYGIDARIDELARPEDDPGKPYGESSDQAASSSGGLDQLRRVFGGASSSTMIGRSKQAPENVRGAAVTVCLAPPVSRRRSKHKPPRLVACFEDRSLGIWKWSYQLDSGSPSFSARLLDSKRRLAKAHRFSGAPWPSSVALLTAREELVISLGYDDGHLRVHDLDKGDLLAATRGAHSDVLTHVAVDHRDPRSSLFVTGSRDATLCVWVAANECLADALAHNDDTDDDGDFFANEEEDAQADTCIAVLELTAADDDDDDDLSQRPSTTAPFVGKRRRLFAPGRAACLLREQSQQRQSSEPAQPTPPSSLRRRRSDPSLQTERAHIARVASSPQHHPRPVVCSHKLWGHRTPIASVAYSSTLDVVVSGAEDGACCVHSARSGTFVTRLDKCCQAAVDCLEVLDATCEFVAHASETRELVLLTLNAKRRARIRATSDALDGRYIAIRATTDAEVLVCAAFQNASLDVRDTYTLALQHSIDLLPFGAPITLEVSPHDTHLFVGTAEGAVLVLSDPSSHLYHLDVAFNSTVFGAIWDSPFA